MNLTLEVMSANGQAMGASRRKQFGPAGGRIGRDADCDWVLPSPNKYIHRHHATVLFANGSFYIKSEGTNGISINDPAVILPLGKPNALRNGDRLFIDEYEILASIAQPAELVPGLDDDPFGGLSLVGSAPVRGTPNPPLIGPLEDESLDPLRALGMESKGPIGPDFNYEAISRGNVLNDPFIPPRQEAVVPPQRTDVLPRDLLRELDAVDPTPERTQPPPRRPERLPDQAGGGGAFIPSDPSAWDKTTYQKTDDKVLQKAAEFAKAQTQTQAPERPRLRPPPPPPVHPPLKSPQPPLPSQSDGAKVTAGSDSARLRKLAADSAGPAAEFDMAALLRAAGVDPQNVTPELAATFGQIFKVVVQGTIDALRARDEIKTEFRLAVTRVKSSDNNPLSFSVDAADAINSLLNRRNAAYLPPIEAFQRAFDDIRAHQVAMLAGMRAGFENVISRFDPEALREGFEKQSKRGGLLGAMAKPNYWDLYTSYFNGVRGDREDAFRRLFGEEFALAYEKQIELLKRSRAKKSP